MAEQKKMNVVQLTFIVTVNMMGSGIIMLPSNMAQVGAISLLSWIVTAIGSMAIAYGFAQAGIFNQRAGGMAAYAEDAYGKSGYFLVFFLYFLSLAIANVAVASSALGYLAAFFPLLTSTPVMSCIGVIGLLWLTTVANFGGPKITGRLGSITVWGVILPVGFMAVGGWIWFKSEIFAAAWNPQGLSLFQGMSSSISLTLWAFLGMESAAQNGSAVENPKRDVPLASLFGTLGAAVIYILSTTVIQGIVPNAELAKSTGPFGLAYAHMFNPQIGQIVMALAAMACVGSLLGWQFTLAQTAKDAADSSMFPKIFSKVTSVGAPLAGMVIMGIVQSLMALSTMSPNLSEQFSMLVNLSVVTNVIPYIVALSALFVIMRNAGVDKRTYQRNTIVALIAMAYSIYALHAAGKDAVLGGMLVLGVGFVIWGLIAPRFTGAGTKPALSGAAAAVVAALAIALCTTLPATSVYAQQTQQAQPAVTSSLDRIKQSGKITLGYRTDARPFAYLDGAGKPTGYSVALCKAIADQIKSQLALPSLELAWMQVEAGDHHTALQQHRIDLLCSDALTLSGMREIAFSVPVYPGGIGALLRNDAPAALKDVLSDTKSVLRPWRAAPAQIVSQQTLSAVAGGTAESWVLERLKTLKLDARYVPVDGFDTGVKHLLERKANVFFAEHAILQEAARQNPSLNVLDRRFTYTPIAMSMARDDADLRLLVDTALSRLYRSGEIRALYTPYFGEPDADMSAFFRMSALPE